MTKDELIGRAREMWDLFVSALTCLYEALVGKEISCPPCWKCTTLRWIMGVGMAVGLHALFGGWFILASIVLLLYLISFGDGFWKAIREAIAAGRNRSDL